MFLSLGRGVVGGITLVVAGHEPEALKFAAAFWLFAGPRHAPRSGALPLR